MSARPFFKPARKATAISESAAHTDAVACVISETDGDFAAYFKILPLSRRPASTCRCESLRLYMADYYRAPALLLANAGQVCSLAQSMTACVAAEAECRDFRYAVTR